METNAPIPRYYLYGRLDDDAGEVEIDFLHIEPIRKRSGPNNWTISPHAHPAHVQVLFVRRGGGSIEIEGGEIPIAVPALMVVPTAAVHQIRFLPDTDGWVITAADSYLTRAAQGDNRLIETTRHAGVFALEGTDLDPRSVETLFEQLMREFVYSAPGRRPAVTARPGRSCSPRCPSAWSARARPSGCRATPSRCRSTTKPSWLWLASRT